MATTAWDAKYKGGVCYAACQDVFNWYSPKSNIWKIFNRFNPSVLHCRRGCDFAVGRMNDPVLREEAFDMCKRYTSELYPTTNTE